MFFVAKRTLAIILPATMLAPFGVGTQLTGKERLGEKWKDEQRIDNCKVPFDKRGTKPQSDSCAHLPTS